MMGHNFVAQQPSAKDDGTCTFYKCSGCTSCIWLPSRMTLEEGLEAYPELVEGTVCGQNTKPRP